MDTRRGLSRHDEEIIRRAFAPREPTARRPDRRDLEVARVYYPDGSLHAERLRVRERDEPTPRPRSDAQEAGWLALIWLAGTAYACGATGAAIGGWIGAIIGIGVWATMVWSWM